MKQIIVAMSILLIGCSTPAIRRNSQPDIMTNSKKSAKEIAICISDKWENTKPSMAFSIPPVNTSLKANGYSITATITNIVGSTFTLVLADVTENQLESITTYYKMGGGGLGNYDQAVNDCQVAQIPQPITNNKGNPGNNF